MLEGYAKWVGENPRVATDVEKGVRAVTLLVNGETMWQRSTVELRLTRQDFLGQSINPVCVCILPAFCRGEFTI